MVAVAGFFDFAELRRFVRVRRSAIAFAGLALAGVLLLGVLQGLIVAAALSLVYVVARLSRPSVGGAGARPEHRRVGPHRPPSGLAGPGRRARRAQRRAAAVPERERGQGPRARPARRRVTGPRAVVLDLSQTTELDLQTVDTLGELADALEREGIELRLADVHAPALEVLTRAGLADRVPVEPTLDAAAHA